MADTPTPAEAHASEVENMHVDTVETTPLVVAKEPVAEPEAEVAAAAETTATETAAAEGAETGTTKPPKVDAWVQKRWDDLAKETREAKRAAKQAADELAALRAPKPEPIVPTSADAEAARAEAPAGGYRTQADFDTAVAQAADQRASEIAFNNKSNEIYTAGKTAFGEDFDTAAQNLRSVGAMNKDVLDLVFETDDPAKVLYELGSDPDRAASIIAMPAAKRALEIAKLSVVAPKKAAAAPLSNAPRPVTPVDGSARVSASPSDNDDDETFFRKREAELAAARA